MRYLVAVLAVALLMSCGGGGDDGECTFSDFETPTYDLDGQVWSLSGTTPENNCPEPVTTFDVSGTFSQSGNTLTATGGGVTLIGEISGNQIKWGGTITIGSESATIECTAMDVNGVDIGDTMSFSNTGWTVTYDHETCSGTASGIFTRTL